jgi:hypothetical protein
MRSITRSVVHVAFLLLIAIVAACSDDDTGQATPSSTAVPSASVTATGTATATATVTATPSHAPQGRSGAAALDALIELLLRGQADELAGKFTVSARQHCSLHTAGPPPQQTTMPPAEWTSRFASASRSLYAVFRGQPNEVPSAEYQVVFSVSAADAPTGWRFYVDGDRIVDVVAGCDGPPSVYAPSAAGAYERFVVLPPREDLPKAPMGHALSMRSGVGDVDAVLEVLERRDLQALNALVSLQEFPCSAEQARPSASPAPDPTPPPLPPPLVPCPEGAAPGTAVRGLLELGCFGREARLADRALLNWAIRDGVTLHGVAAIPDGHQPDADHVLVLVSPEAPFRWLSGGLLVRDGRVIGAIEDCGAPEGLYPPSRYLVPQPPIGQTAPGARTSGVQIVDGIIAAMRARDAVALIALTDFDTVECTAEQTGIGGPPLCAPGEPVGTTVGVIWGASCEGYPIRREEVLAAYQRLLEQQRDVFAVTDRGEGESQYSFGRGRYELVFSGAVDPAAPPIARSTRNVALTATQAGVTTLRFGCGPAQPQALISPGRTPDWLIAPPGWQSPG